MRKLLSITLLLPILMGCGKKTVVGALDYSATFTRTVNGANPWTWAFNSKTWGTLTFNQTLYTGPATAGKQTRWTVLLSDGTGQGSLSLTFPGIDSSATLPTGKDLTFSSRITQPDPIAVTCSLIDKGDDGHLTNIPVTLATH